MPPPARDLRPLGLVLAAYLAGMAAMIGAARALEGGSFTYPLDDTYIHLAMAKHLAMDHQWGISTRFASCSSSPLWTVLLAAWDGAFGHGPLAPLALAMLFGTLTLALGWLVLSRQIAHPLAIGLVLLLATAAAPLPTLTLAGLEHVLHAGLSLAFVATVAESLTRDPGARPPSRALLLALAALLAATRYEALFLVLWGCIAFALRGRLGFAVALGLVGLAPVVGNGLWAVSHGWLFFPSSILLKANLPSSRGAGIFTHNSLLSAVRNAPHLMVLMFGALGAVLVSWRAGLRWSRGQVFAGLFIGTAALHIGFARVGWLYRYEAYLVFLGVIATAIAVNECGEQWWPRPAPAVWKIVATVLVLLVLLPLMQRAWDSPIRAVRATKNIHDQQVQVARFLARCYEGAPVAATDVGAISYLANVNLLDLNGLGSIEVARLRLSGRYGSARIQELAAERGIEVAVGYDEWYRRWGGVPSHWVRVGAWRIAGNVVCESDRVNWFATDSAQAARLADNLRSFASELPRDVTQSGAYLDR